MAKQTQAEKRVASQWGEKAADEHPGLPWVQELLESKERAKQADTASSYLDGHLSRKLRKHEFEQLDFTFVETVCKNVEKGAKRIHDEMQKDHERRMKLG